jgi:predicted nucleotidyltransferase
MKDKNIEEKNIENKIKDILKDKLWEKDFSYFLFGSRAKWNFRKNSDYDIGIMWKNKLDLRKYVSLKRELNDKINYNIDLIDFNRVWNDFKEIAFKNIKIWNNWKNIKLQEKN